MNTAPFTVGSKTTVIAADTVAPTGVKPTSLGTDCSQYVFTNVDAADDVYVGWGTTAALATTAAVIPTSGAQTTGFWVMARTQITLTLAPGLFFSGITSAAPANVYITAGDGS